MAERQEVSQEVHDYLSAVGKKGSKKGGQRVKELIEAGKEALEASGEDSEIDEWDESDEGNQTRQ